MKIQLMEVIQMLQTYKATLNGNQLEWNGEVPEQIQNKESVSVIITILEVRNDGERFAPVRVEQRRVRRSRRFRRAFARRSFGRF